MKGKEKRKQRYRIGALLAVMLFILGGCGQKKDAAEVQDKMENVTEQTESGKTAGQTETDLSETQEERTEDILLLVGKKRAAGVQPDGTAQILYECREGDTLQDARYADGTLFVALCREDSFGETEFSLCAVEKGEETLLMELDGTDAGSLEIACIDGGLAAEYQVYDPEADYYSTTVVNFEKEDDAWQQKDDYQYIADISGSQTGSLYRELAFHTWEKEGELIIVDYDTSSLISYDEDGNVLWKSRLQNETYYVYAVNREYAVYSHTEYQENGYDSSLILHNNGTGEETTLYSWDKSTAEEAVTPVCLAGNTLYFYRSCEPQEEHRIFDRKQVYSYDLTKGEETFLYEAGRPAGPLAYTITPGIDDFAVYQGKYYFAAIEEESVGWAVLDGNAKEKEPEDDRTYPGNYLSVWDMERDYCQYGTVEGMEKTVHSDQYELDVYQYYLECFQLDPGYDKEGVINERLEELFLEEQQYGEKNAETELESLPEMMEDSDYVISGYPFSYENTVNRIEKLGENYLTVDYSGYEYAGGAHGYPYCSHYLFDLTTGEEKTLADLYSGSEEEFKDIVAQYSVRDWENDPERYFGFDDADAAYADFYDNAALDMLMRYGTETIVIEYSPYEYGPYASGYIEVEIPYEALNISL